MPHRELDKPDTTAARDHVDEGVVRGLMGLAPRLPVLGGGGYNPWSVGRLWTGVWAELNGIALPDRVTGEAEAVLRALTFEGNRRGKNPPEHWFTTLADAPRGGPVRAEIRERIAVLQDGIRAWA